MAPCEFFSERKAEGQWDVVPVGLFNSVRTECRSQVGLLGNRVSSRLQLAQTQGCRQRGATGSQPRSTAITVEHSEEPQTVVWRGLLRTWMQWSLEWPSWKCVGEHGRGEKNGQGRTFCRWRSVQADLISLSLVLKRERELTVHTSRCLELHGGYWGQKHESHASSFPHMHKTSSLVLIEQQHPKCCCHGSQACLNPGHSSNIFFLVGAELRRLDSMKTSSVLKIFKT